MTIVQESYTIETAEPGFIHVQSVRLIESSVAGGPIDMGGAMWFEHANLNWVIETLRACVTIYGFEKTSLQSGQDTLQVGESGPEQQPIVSLRNRRPADAAHAGAFTLALSKPLAITFVDALAKL
jgi:hypothetical protein